MAIEILNGDCLDILSLIIPENSIDCCVTSPPYFGLRDYGVENQIGLESTPDEYVTKLVEVFRAVKSVLKEDGTLWLNLGDSYAGSGKGGNPGHSPHIKQKTNAGSMTVQHKKVGTFPGIKEKNLIGIPWRVAFALQADGWYLRSAIIWAKPNGMPGSQKDRCSSSYETIFFLTKNKNYFSDFDAIKTPPRESTRVRLTQNVQAQAGSHRANAGAKTNGSMKDVGGKQNGHSRQHAGFNERWNNDESDTTPVRMRDVWFISPGGYKGAHFAVMPEEIARRCILAGCPENGIVLDPFAGTGTTGVIAQRFSRNAFLIELNPSYIELIHKHLNENKA